MSSLRIVGPRRAIFDLQAQQNDCALLIKQIERQENISKYLKFSGKVVAVTIALVVCFLIADKACDELARDSYAGSRASMLAQDM